MFCYNCGTKMEVVDQLFLQTNYKCPGCGTTMSGTRCTIGDHEALSHDIAIENEVGAVCRAHYPPSGGQYPAGVGT